MESGDLPRLSAIMDQGSFSLLKSVIPPHTAPGWTSITTGVNPGKHGIYYFHNFSTTPTTITNSYQYVDSKNLGLCWSLEERSAVVNVPVTYPVHKISGSMVAGIPPWYFDEKSVYPDDLIKKLKSEDYEIDTPMSRGLEKQPEELVNRLLATEEKRLEVFLNLLNETEWSFGMIVFTALDRLQHKLVGKGDVEEKAVRRGYHEIDRLVGKLVDSLASTSTSSLFRIMVLIRGQSHFIQMHGCTRKACCRESRPLSIILQGCCTIYWMGTHSGSHRV